MLQKVANISLSIVTLTITSTLIQICSHEDTSIYDLTLRHIYGYTTYTYNIAHVDTIDDFVMNKCNVANKIIKDNSIMIPDSGYYKYTLSNRTIIYIRKMFIQKNNKEYWIYKIYSPNTKTFKLFSKILQVYSNKLNTINVMSIDTSTDSPQVISLTKLCNGPKFYQQQAIQFVLDHWTDIKNNYNTKIILYGNRGTGKTYTGRLLKKYMEQHYIQSGITPILYDDVNPSSIGLNINKLILNSATNITPVIIVINEIDTIYDKVLNGPEPYDHRLQHSRNVNDFHNMLDGIGDCSNVIAIYTTEKNANDLYNDDKYKSFMRPGRVDFFLHMDRSGTSQHKN